MRQMWSAVARTLGGLALTIALLTGTGAGLFHMGRALADTGGRRADGPEAGVDPMPVVALQRRSRS